MDENFALENAIRTVKLRDAFLCYIAQWRGIDTEITVRVIYFRHCSEKNNDCFFLLTITGAWSK